MTSVEHINSKRLLVLAGGFGTRLKSVLGSVPKALAPIGDVPFLHLQIENWVKQGVTSFVFLLHNQAEAIVFFLDSERNGLLKNCEVQYIIEPIPMGTGGATAYAIQQLKLSGEFLLTNADTWLESGIDQIWKSKHPVISLVCSESAERYGTVEIDSHKNVTAFHEKRCNPAAGWINAGLYHLDAKWFAGWDEAPFSIERLLFPLLVNRGELKAELLHTNFIDIGTPDDYARFCRWAISEKAGFVWS